MNKRNITICVSWPYANNNLHLGYIASSVSADILARYHRMVGDNVMMVSGTDSHGTKPSIKAKEQGCTPKDIVDKYNENFVESLNAFDFSFDGFGITYHPFHKENTKKLFLEMYKNGYLYEKVEKRPYCEHCQKFVNDTEVEIVCPRCGKSTKADNCDCGYVPVEKDLENAKCLICGNNTKQTENKVLVFKLTAFKDFLQNHLNKNKDFWRANSINESQKYIDDLRDRDFSRDLDWGVEIPIPGFEDKVVWVWWEALLGYITETMKVCEKTNQDWKRYWKKDVEPENEKMIYLCHAKDNIVFHSLLLPAMLESLNDNYFIPNKMVSAEYLLMNDQKISKSKSGNAFDAINWAKEYNTDTLRFHFVLNGPEKRDSNFTLDLYKATHNEIVNKFGNLVNRTLKYKGLETLPRGEVNVNIKNLIEKTYEEVKKEIENIEFKKAGQLVMELVEAGNKYFDEQKPWVLKNENVEEFNNTIYTCAYLIANLGNLFEPFMPKSAKKIREYFGISEYKWNLLSEEINVELAKVEPLFTRI